MFRAAAEGDTKVARQLVDLVAQAESGRVSAAFNALEYAIHYKETYLPIFEEHEREGREPPDIYPHPDDVLIDQRTGTFTIDGPETKEQADAQRAVRDRALKSLGRYFEVEAALRTDRSNRALRREFEILKQEHEILKKDAERMLRHKALRLARRGVAPDVAIPKPETPARPEPEADE